MVIFKVRVGHLIKYLVGHLKSFMLKALITTKFHTGGRRGLEVTRVHDTQAAGVRILPILQIFTEKAHIHPQSKNLATENRESVGDARKSEEA